MVKQCSNSMRFVKFNDFTSLLNCMNPRTDSVFKTGAVRMFWVMISVDISPSVA